MMREGCDGFGHADTSTLKSVHPVWVRIDGDITPRELFTGVSQSGYRTPRSSGSPATLLAQGRHFYLGGAA